MNKFWAIGIITSLTTLIYSIAAKVPRSQISSTQTQSFAPLPTKETLLPISKVPVQENIIFPKDSGIVNIKDAPFNARGDGFTDDTVAIQQALSLYPNKNKIIYLPQGTYLVSDQLQ